MSPAKNAMPPSMLRMIWVKAFFMASGVPLTGRGDSTMREPQGVASLALGYVLYWAFSPPLLNPKIE